MTAEHTSTHTPTPPAISVVIPAFNTGAYLRRCLDSVLAQRFTDFEVVFVDDGSNDDSAKIFEEYLPRFSQSVLIRQENQGLSKARNVGIEAAHGNFIAFIDSDDWIAPTMLASLHAAITESGSDIAQVDYATCSSIDFVPKQASHETRRILNSREALCEMLTEEKYAVWCRLYARHLFEGDDEVFPVGLTCEDRVANFKLMAKAQGVVVSDRIEYFYFLNYGSISYNGLDRRGFDLLEADARILAMAQKLGDAQVLDLVQARAAKGSFSLLIKWARFGITDPELDTGAVEWLKQRYRQDYPRLMASPLPAAKKFVVFQLRYMPQLLKAEFKLYTMLFDRRKGSLG